MNNVPSIAGACNKNTNLNPTVNSKTLGGAEEQRIDIATRRQIATTEANAASSTVTFTSDLRTEAEWLNHLKDFYKPFIESSPIKADDRGMISAPVSEIFKYLEHKSEYRRIHREDYLKIIETGVKIAELKSTNPELYNMRAIFVPIESTAEKVKNIYNELLTVDLTPADWRFASDNIEQLLRLLIKSA